jgi:hypothetical protein
MGEGLARDSWSRKLSMASSEEHKTTPTTSMREGCGALQARGSWCRWKTPPGPILGGERRTSVASYTAQTTAKDSMFIDFSSLLLSRRLIDGSLFHNNKTWMILLRIAGER